MTYKETLFFVAKCLTINHEAHNKLIVEEVLQSDTVDWDEVVKLSTAHYVFPALYCNLKRASFLSYLPEDLVEYMKYITELNRERNEEIIAQAKELNTLLLEHDITPIFIKGTGNLLEGLYEDIAERMVGDIDFLFSKKDIFRAVIILKPFGYFSDIEQSYLFPGTKHYPRLKNHNKIAAVEIHQQLMKFGNYYKDFSYNFIKRDLKTINKITLLSYKNQLSLSIIASQINDYGFKHKSIALRNAYDVFLLSKKTKAKNAFKKLNRLEHPLDCFLASCFEVFNKPSTLKYTKTKKIEKYLVLFHKYLNNRELAHKLQKKYSREKTRRKKFIPRLKIIWKSFFYIEYRTWLYKKITDKNWRKEKLIQLGIKKP
jgi:hypothetical protein